MFDITKFISLVPAPLSMTDRGRGDDVTSLAGVSAVAGGGAAVPVVTWMITRGPTRAGNCVPECGSAEEMELTPQEALSLVDDLADYGITKLILAGGDPLERRDVEILAEHAHQRGVSVSLRTPGWLLTRPRAMELKQAGLAGASIRYAPESLWRTAYENCEAVGLPAELRIPLSRGNYFALANILKRIESAQIRRVVFTHRVSGGEENSPQAALTHAETRRAMDLIMEAAGDFEQRRLGIQTATDENHADGIYFGLRLARRQPWRAAGVFRLLARGAAHRVGAGMGIAAIDAGGNVYPDAYWANHVIGNVRERPFGEIWEDLSDPLLRGLRNRLPRLTGRCGNCLWKHTCGGNLRVRAEKFFGDPWTSDPACYLNNNEVGKKVFEHAEAMAEDVLLLGQAA